MMRTCSGRFRLLPAVLLSVVLSWFPAFGAEQAFMYGVDVVDSDTCRGLEGRKVGLITNMAGVTSSGEPNYLMMLRHGVDLRFLMAPEHGFHIDVAAGREVTDARLLDSLEVHSLYGKQRKPSRELLEKIDVLVFDLQDIGTRCYTYISTMWYAMQAARETGTAFVVLDRPNPISPFRVDGFVTAPGFRSFVAAFDVPFLHGMTVGELALWLAEHHLPDLHLEVVRMTGYDRRMFADEIEGFRFYSPSPNIRDVETAVVYPATVFLEATAISEGRGTALPFKQFGAPFLDPEALISVLEQFQLQGVRWVPTSFRPASSKYAGELCRGVRIEITSRSQFQPFRTGVALLVALYQLYPQQLDLDSRGDFFDKLAGTALLRRMITASSPFEEIVTAARCQAEAFDRRFPQRTVYP
ncbi:DUF1343 domain-containing protein [Prosthecochloris sp. ZM_2]|uniref:exo-beta-N-acetylmuramidase NamZ family protein n=1 Tax=Prosthecochloris sp. ZM_2 TaxID=2045206 RepID=UPI000DF827D3|nr:DUF1343 domain-containing protein [Prosthecochloris sp. ZM_2]RNA64768.1 DUF1343 domain-containing protein [Prosthecochloris sp. ZM_2]